MSNKPLKNEWQQLNSMKRIFFVGIGGISMSGLAELSRSFGHEVTGSDRHLTERTEELERIGISVHEGHQGAWIDQFKPDLVVHTAAVHDDNPELMRARELGIRLVDRATYLGWLNLGFDQVVNIAGTHGKTTTTAMCSLILIDAGVDPTVHLGAELIQFKSTVRSGAPGRVMVSEACEYKNSYHRFHSTTAAVLNIDYDHVDCFANLDEVIESFTEFTDHLPTGGQLVVPAFDTRVQKMLAALKRRRLTAGQPMPKTIWFGGNSDLTVPGQDAFCYDNLTYEQGLSRFDVLHNGLHYCTLSLHVPGLHNVHNALAAIACAHTCGGTPEAASRALNDFRGAEGRFTETGTYRGARVIADYAHHPAAARATLEAASHVPHNKTWVVFQPLTFSRTKVLMDEFADALKDCEWLVLAEIYSDREKTNLGISSRDLADRINALGGNALFEQSFETIQKLLDERVQPGDLILVLGPEDIRTLADKLTGRTSHLE